MSRNRVPTAQDSYAGSVEASEQKVKQKVKQKQQKMKRDVAKATVAAGTVGAAVATGGTSLAATGAVAGASAVGGTAGGTAGGAAVTGATGSATVTGASNVAATSAASVPAGVTSSAVGTEGLAAGETGAGYSVPVSPSDLIAGAPPDAAQTHVMNSNVDMDHTPISEYQRTGDTSANTDINGQNSLSSRKTHRKPSKKVDKKDKNASDRESNDSVNDTFDDWTPQSYYSTLDGNRSESSRGGDDKQNQHKTRMKRQAIASLAVTASKSLMHLQFLLFLKQMMMMLMMLLQAMAHAVVAAVTGIVHAVVAVVTTVVQTVAAVLGVGLVTAAVVLFPVVGLAVAGVTAVVYMANQVTNPAYYEPLPPDCGTVLEDHIENMDRPEGDHSLLQIEAAKTINSLLRTYANTDAIHVAGILGNAQRESGIDPTAVQNVYSEPFFIGEGKRAILQSSSASDHGIGIFQWTFSRHTDLMDFADEKGMNWYDIKTQMAYFITESSHSVLDDYLTRDFGGSLHDATIWFDDNWERSGDTTGSEGEAIRVRYAENWLAEIANWEINTELGDSIIDLAGSSRLDSENSALQAEYDKCVPAQLYNCDSIAAAAASYAWLSTSYAMTNDGTPLYQCVHDAVFPGDPYYQSCDRGAATAIRWSGADDQFPAGACAQQLEYCLTHPTVWAHVGAIGGYGDLSLSDLKPGDLLICDACHTLIHTGHEIIEQTFPDRKSKFDSHNDTISSERFDALRFVEASFESTSPHCIPAYTSYFDNEVDTTGIDSHMHRYEVFRCQTTTLSQTYKDAAANINSYR